MALYTLGLNISFMARSNVGFDSNFDEFNELMLPSLILAIYSFLVASLLMCLTIFHTFLMLNNQTSSEYIRDKYYTWDGNPYDYGNKWLNFRYFWNIQESLIYGPNAEQLNKLVIE